MKYIVLLRGINISGKNKISMEELKKYLIENEYQSVYTYLNSGNIILESNELNKENIVKNIHSLIKEKFDLEIPVFVISYLELENLLSNSPSWWGTGNKEIYDNIIFINSYAAYGISSAKSAETRANNYSSGGGGFSSGGGGGGSFGGGGGRRRFPLE